jgi:hypothetical protein
LSRYADNEFLDVEKDQDNKEQSQQLDVMRAAGDDLGGSIAEVRSTRPDANEEINFTHQAPSTAPTSSRIAKTKDSSSRRAGSGTIM